MLQYINFLNYKYIFKENKLLCYYVIKTWQYVTSKQYLYQRFLEEVRNLHIKSSKKKTNCHFIEKQKFRTRADSSMRLNSDVFSISMENIRKKNNQHTKKEMENYFVNFFGKENIYIIPTEMRLRMPHIFINNFFFLQNHSEKLDFLCGQKF